MTSLLEDFATKRYAVNGENMLGVRKPAVFSAFNSVTFYYLRPQSPAGMFSHQVLT